MAKDYLSDFVLVGGTNLALQLGHRHSIDLDFFTNTAFDSQNLHNRLSIDYEMAAPHVMTGSTLIVDIQKVKVDFIRYKYAFAYPFVQEEGLTLLDIRDVAPMKIDAITGRGRKKDFYDLFFLLQKYELNEMMEWYNQLFHKVTLFHVWKSLTYFDDAETDADPVVFDTDVTWPVVKEMIRERVRIL